MTPSAHAQPAVRTGARPPRGPAVTLCAVVALLGACSGGPDDAGATGSGQIVVQTGLPASANGIDAQLEPGRADPEGMAPNAPAVSRIRWKDARNAERSLSLYAYLYQYDFSFAGGSATPGQVTQRSANDNALGHPGFGYVVSHNTETGNSPLGKTNAPGSVQSVVFAGGHHALHRIDMVYDRDKEPDGQGVRIPVVIEWLVATGRDHPVWSVTYKMGEAIKPGGLSFDTFRMDTRGPYGSLNFDGAANAGLGDEVGGVAWGDAGLRFRSQGSPLTLNAAWTYNGPNNVNHVHAWTAHVNAEMGIVQTRTGDKFMGYGDRVLGRERGSTSAGAFANKGDCLEPDDLRSYLMPCISGWPYQMMNFDWGIKENGPPKPSGESTSTKLLAWGSPYGWLGASAFDAFDQSETGDGRGDRSYATFIVLGPQCRYDGAGTCTQDGDVALTLLQVQALSGASLGNATTGAVATQAPTGPGAASVKALVNGYDDAYAVYRLDADANRVAFTFTPAAGRPVERPIFVVRNYRARQLPTVRVDGQSLSVNTGGTDAGAFVSIDTRQDTLWLTLNRTLSAASAIQIGF